MIRYIGNYRIGIVRENNRERTTRCRGVQYSPAVQAFCKVPVAGELPAAEKHGLRRYSGKKLRRRRTRGSMVGCFEQIRRER